MQYKNGTDDFSARFVARLGIGERLPLVFLGIARLLTNGHLSFAVDASVKYLKTPLRPLVDCVSGRVEGIRSLTDNRIEPPPVSSPTIQDRKGQRDIDTAEPSHQTSENSCSSSQPYSLPDIASNSSR